MRLPCPDMFFKSSKGGIRSGVRPGGSASKSSLPPWLLSNSPHGDQCVTVCVPSLPPGKGFIISVLALLPARLWPMPTIPALCFSKTFLNTFMAACALKKHRDTVSLQSQALQLGRYDHQFVSDPVPLGVFPPE